MQGLATRSPGGDGSRAAVCRGFGLRLTFVGGVAPVMRAVSGTVVLVVLAAVLGGAAAGGTPGKPSATSPSTKPTSPTPPSKPIAPSVPSAPEDPFYKGLEARGLSSLMEAYLKSKSAPSTATAPGTKTPGAPPGSALALATLECQKGVAAKIIGDRDAAFKKAKQYYEQALAEASHALAAVPADKTTDRFNARLAVLKIRLALADMIYKQWLDKDLEYLEITDRRAGDRQAAIALLKVAGDQYRAVLEDCKAWLSDIDHLDPAGRAKYFNFDREVKKAQRDAQYSSDWITYYYAWVLPVDYTPAEKERSRKQMLDDAITAFMAYTRMPDRVSAKWYAHMIIGLCYRELGKFDEALQSLAIADTTKIKDPDEVAKLRIRVAFERAQTLLRQGKKEEARKVVGEARTAWKDKLGNALFGVALSFVEADSYILEGADKNDASVRKKGFDILQQMYNRPEPFPTIVEQVITSLGGAAGVGAATAEAIPEDPFVMRMEGKAKMNEGEQKAATDAKAAGEAYKRAAALFRAYAQKAGPQDPNYPEAVYFEAACLSKINQKAEAAEGFFKVADGFPKFMYAKDAARYAVKFRGEMYMDAGTEENRQAYEDVLKWFVAKWLDIDPEQQYYYGITLNRGRKFIEAGDAFKRVSEKLSMYPESRYWIPVCRLENFREKIVPSGQKELIVGEAVNVSRDLLAYAAYAFAAKGKGLPKEKEDQLLEWAEAAYVNAAEVFLYPEVALFDRALPILADTEAKFTLSEFMRGRILKLRIEAYQKSGKLKDAQETLTAFLKVAKPDEVGPVLRGLFKAMTDDVREAVKRNTPESRETASKQVDAAKALGDMLRQWLEQSAIPDKAEQIVNNRYDVAELYLAVGRYKDALGIYQEIGGPQPHVLKKDPKTGKDLPLKEECIYGQARAHEGLGETAADAAQAKASYETAIEMWRVLKDIAEADREKGADRGSLWERRYHLCYCRYKLGFKQEVLEVLKAWKSMNEATAAKEPMGGKDPAMQQKFIQLTAACSGGG